MIRVCNCLCKRLRCWGYSAMRVKISSNRICHDFPRSVDVCHTSSIVPSLFGLNVMRCNSVSPDGKYCFAIMAIEPSAMRPSKARTTELRTRAARCHLCCAGSYIKTESPSLPEASRHFSIRTQPRSFVVMESVAMACVVRSFTIQLPTRKSSSPHPRRAIFPRYSLRP